MASGFDFSAFIGGFQEEAEERLQAIESTLVDLEQGRMDSEQLEKLRRDAHSVKGSANMLQLRDIGETAHVLEDTFAYLRDGAAAPDQAYSNFMFDLLDSLRSRIQAANDSNAEHLDAEGFRFRLENLDSETGLGEEAGTSPEPGTAPATEAEPAAEPDPEEESGPPPGDREAPAAEARDTDLGGAPEIENPAAEPEEFEGALQEAGEIASPDPEGDAEAAGMGDLEVPSLDWSGIIPDLREDAKPVLKEVDDLLAVEEASSAPSDDLLDRLEALATSCRQVELNDAAEALDLVAMVLESPAAGDLPDSLLQLLQGLVERVGQRLDRADQPDPKPLDRDRLWQARELLKRWGMVHSPSAGSADGEYPGFRQAEKDGSAGDSVWGAPDPEAAEDGPSHSGHSAPDEPSPIGGPEARQGSRESSGSSLDVSPFLDGYQAEAREDLNVIQEALLQAEQGALDSGSLQRVAQKAHSLKGSANMLGLEDIGASAEVLEDGLSWLGSGKLTKGGVDALLELHDALAEATEQVQGDARPRLDSEHWRRRLNEQWGTGELLGGSQEESFPEHLSQSESEPSPGPTGTSGWRESDGQQKAGRDAGNVPGEAQPAGVEGGIHRRKPGANRGTLRVSAERLERLSDGVIGLAMDRATQEDRRAEMDRIVADLREVRHRWEWFESILPETGSLVGQREKFSEQLNALSHEVTQYRQQSEYDISARHSLYDEIHQRVMDLMVTPLGTIFSVLPRSARDLAQRFQKRVELEIDGSEIELERKNVDALLEPLVHLVTNALSHGIEDPDERRSAGKDPVGHIWVKALHVGGEVAISVTDDGRGIDYEEVRETAIRTGVTTAAEAASMLPYDLLQMLFRPGFSTKQEVSQISGRGIGMNAVRDAVQRMTGSIQVDSDVGQGATFTLNIPVSTAVQRILKFRVGDEIFGVLANQVDHIMSLSEAVITETRGQRFFTYQGTQVPVTWLSELFQTTGKAIYETGSLRLVVVRHLEGYIGFVVHEVLEETQAVVKDVTNYMRRHAVQGLIGTTISGSGEVQLLLEPTGIKEMERTAPLTLHDGERLADDPLKGLRVLLVEDSPLAREMEKTVLESSGMAVDTAVDGLDALDRIEVRIPDVVISDVEMPRMDGYDLLRKLRDDDRYRGVPVFMVTSRDSEEDRETARRLGADGFLNKLDLQSGDLIEEIRGRLERLYA